VKRANRYKKNTNKTEPGEDMAMITTKNKQTTEVQNAHTAITTVLWHIYSSTNLMFKTVCRVPISN
jgi:hypothetical protein